MKKLSVITINYNNAGGLARTIQSVAGQNSPGLEFIIIDGGSTDGSVEVIKQFEHEITYWVSEKDSGIYNAQNKGIKNASGEYCIFLNSGDLFANKDVVNTILPHLKDCDILYGDIITINKEGKSLLKSPRKTGVYEMMISTIWHPSAFIKRALFSSSGLYNESFKITGDYEFFIRTVLRDQAKTKHIDLDIALFDMGGISNTATAADLQAEERKRSWQLNFSDVLIEAFEDKTRILRSREYKLASLLMKIKIPFSGKK